MISKREWRCAIILYLQWSREEHGCEDELIMEMIQPYLVSVYKYGSEFNVTPQKPHLAIMLSFEAITFPFISFSHYTMRCFSNDRVCCCLPLRAGVTIMTTITLVSSLQKVPSGLQLD